MLKRNNKKNLPTKKKGIIKLLFSKKSEIQGDNALVAFLQSVNSFIFSILGVLLWLTALGLFYGIFLVMSSKQTFITIPIYLFLIVMSVFWAQIFRRIGIEIENLSDRDTQISLFTAIVTVMALLVAVLALKLS